MLPSAACELIPKVMFFSARRHTLPAAGYLIFTGLRRYADLKMACFGYCQPSLVKITLPL